MSGLGRSPGSLVFFSLSLTATYKLPLCPLEYGACTKGNSMANPAGFRPHRRDRALRLWSLGLLVGICLIHQAMAAESLCDPGFVHGPAPTPAVRLVAATATETIPDGVTIQWLGHSSFLIITPGGTTALTDPHPWHTARTTPDVITVSNERPTHNQVHTVPGQGQILRGPTSTGESAWINVTVGDLSIRGMPSSDLTAIDAPPPNTVFIFRANGLCIVHLGNLRRPLTDAQRQRLGRPDLLMAPIDGQWTLSYEQVALTIVQLQPAIVLPMHYDAPEHARLFMQFIQGMLPIRTVDDTRLRLTRATLPRASELFVLGYRGGGR